MKFLKVTEAEQRGGGWVIRALYQKADGSEESHFLKISQEQRPDASQMMQEAKQWAERLESAPKMIIRHMTHSDANWSYPAPVKPGLWDRFARWILSWFWR